MNPAKEILLFYAKDAKSRDMYAALKHLYSRSEIREAFLSLKALGYLTRTNPRGPNASVFCITRLGRELLRTQYGISLEHPDGVPK